MQIKKNPKTKIKNKQEDHDPQCSTEQYVFERFKYLKKKYAA